MKSWRQKELDLKREGKRRRYILRAAREKMSYLEPPQLKRLRHPPSKRPMSSLRRCRILFCPVISGFPLHVCVTARVRVLPRAQTSRGVPVPPTCLPLPGGGLEGPKWEGDVCQAFPLLAHTRGCLEAHLQPSPLPFLFQLAALAMKPLNLTGSMQAFNGSLLKQMF